MEKSIRCMYLELKLGKKDDMGVGHCCSPEEREIIDGRIKYYGNPSTSSQPYLQSEYFSSRTESLNVLSLGGGANPNFTYDIRVSDDFLVSCHGSAGVIISKYKNKSVTAHTNINGSGGNTRSFQGRFGDYYWSGDRRGTRYGFDNFTGSYGADFYTSKSIFIARGQDVVYYDIENNTYKNVASFSGTIANKVACLNGYLYVGTCGYTPPPNPNNYPEYGSYTQSLLSIKKQSHGVYVYKISKILEGKVGSAFIKKIDLNSDVTDMKSGSERVFIGTRRGCYGAKVTINPDTKIPRVEYDPIGFNEQVTAVDAIGDDVFFTAVSNFPDRVQGSVYKNGNLLFKDDQYKNNPWCLDDFINCFDFNTLQDFKGSYGAIILNQRNSYILNSRSLLATCSGGVENIKSPEQIGTFPTGIGVDENYIVLSMWQNGVYFLDHSGNIISSRKGWVESPSSCADFSRSSIDQDPTSYNPEYSISAGPIAVGNGDVFVADSVQFALGGSGPMIYNPIKNYDSYQENLNFTTLIQGFNIFGGIIHFHD
jgi:hypothetical protein